MKLKEVIIYLLFKEKELEIKSQKKMKKMEQKNLKKYAIKERVINLNFMQKFQMDKFK